MSVGEAFFNLLTLMGGICAAFLVIVAASEAWVAWSDRYVRREAESRAAHPTLMLFESMRDDAIEPHSGTGGNPGDRD